MVLLFRLRRQFLVFHGSSDLLVYENAPGSIAAKYNCFDLFRYAFLRKLSECVWNVCKSVLSTPTEADISVDL